MIGRRREVEQLLEDFVRSSDYGRGWARVAAAPQGVFRLKPDQMIPVVRMIFMGDRPGFISPFRKLMDGHRTVDRKPEYGLGALGDGELAIQPTISVEVVTDAAYLAAAMRGATQIDESIIRNPSLVFSVPAHFLLPKWKDNDWAIAQICGRDGRLSVVQVKAIRELAKNHTPEEIYVRIGAKDVNQVKRVLDGKTYARIA